MIKANVLNRNFDPNNPNPRSSISEKWMGLFKPIWDKYKKKYDGEEEYEERGPYKYYKGKGVVVIPSDPNALLERYRPIAR